MYIVYKYSININIQCQNLKRQGKVYMLTTENQFCKLIIIIIIISSFTVGFKSMLGAPLLFLYGPPPSVPLPRVLLTDSSQTHVIGQHTLPGLFWSSTKQPRASPCVKICKLLILDMKRTTRNHPS